MLYLEYIEVNQLLNRKGQVTIFVIIGIIIVVAAVAFFAIKGPSPASKLPTTVQPVETAFLSCLQAKAEQGIQLMETHAGYIKQPAFVPGSNYQPTSSKLDFIGTDIPYWFYMNNANIPETQVPTLDQMQAQLANFISQGASSCGLQNTPYKVNIGPAKADVNISNNYVDFDVKVNLVIDYNGTNYIVNDHSFRVSSKLGFLYDYAKNVYGAENNNSFLENYSVDVMRLYLPVDGVKISCSPLTWNGPNLYSTFTQALQENYLHLNNDGKKGDYFNTGFSQTASVKFLYFSNWPTYFEANPAEGNLLKAEPVGNQQGLGILGFCYVPYHFVYNIRHPVLVQVTSGNETFQFPTTVRIEGNLPKKAANGTISSDNTVNLCQYANTNVSFSVYNSDLNPINANLTYNCLASSCEIGSTQNGGVTSTLPQCVNGVVHATSPGYAPLDKEISTVNSSDVILIMNKEYNLSLDLESQGQLYTGRAVLTFANLNTQKTVVYPDQKSVQLSPGTYNISATLYENTSLELGAFSKEQCYTVPRNGILGAAGLTTQNCVNVSYPKQMVTTAVVGGGNATSFFSEPNLKSSSKLFIDAGQTNNVTTLAQLQVNYALMDTNKLEVKLE